MVRVALILCAIPSLLAAAACLLPFLVLGAIFSVVKTPEEKDRKRQLKELEQQGRVLDWQEARARVVAGSGTFMVDGDPWRIRYLWWIHLSRDALDPAGSFESWNGNFRTLLIGCSSRRDLERVIHGAFLVRQHRPHYAAIPDQLVRLPTIEIDRSLLKVALTSEVTDPISWPTGDPTSDAIRAERDRLLDLRDQAVNQAEYEQLTEIDRQVKALEQQFLAMTGAAPVERRDTMQSRLHMFALPLFDVVLCSNDAGGRPSKLAVQMIESALSELRQIEKIDQSLAPRDPLHFNRETAALIRGMYEKWGGEAEALLSRIDQVEKRFGRLTSSESLRDAVGRTRAMLSISLDDMEEARRQIREGRLTPVGEVRRELRIGAQ